MPQDLAPWAEVFAVLTVGALASLPTLTSKARLRNRITFWTAQSKEAELEYDRKFAESVRRDATARLVALEAYPVGRFLAATYGTVLGGGLAWVVGSDMGETYPTTWTLDRLFNSENVDLSFLPGLPILGPLFFVLGIMQLARVVVLRQRVAEQYLRAETIQRGSVAVRKSGKVVAIEDAQGPLHLTWQALLGLLALSAGLYLITVVVAFAVVSGAGMGKPDDGYQVFMLSVAMLGAALSFSGGLSVVGLFLNEKKEWKHPRPLVMAASVPRSDYGQDKQEPEIEKSWWHIMRRKRSQ